MPIFYSKPAASLRHNLMNPVMAKVHPPAPIYRYCILL